MKKALTAGLTGQDDAYLAELLKAAERDELVKRHGHFAYDYHE